MTPYEAVLVLETPKAKSFGGVRSAYRRLAVKYHPDKSKVKDADEKFKQIGIAITVLNEYQRNGGIWPIPRGYDPAKQATGTKSPTSSYVEPPQYQQHQKKSKQRHSGPPPPQHDRRDKSWRKKKSQTPREETDYTHQTSLVQAEEFNRRMGRYFQQIFPNEAVSQAKLNEVFGENVSLEDIKTILANHVSGGAPLKIEYTPYGRKVTFEHHNGGQGYYPQPPPAPASPPPQEARSGFSFGSPLKAMPNVQSQGGYSFAINAPNQPVHGYNYIQSAPQPFPPPAPATAPPTAPPMAAPPVMPNVLHINPMVYNQIMQTTGGMPGQTIIRALLQTSGGLMSGLYDIHWFNGIPHVSGIPCALTLDSSAPL